MEMTFRFDEQEMAWEFMRKAHDNGLTILDYGKDGYQYFVDFRFT